MARVALRGVFARIFLKNRPWTLSPEMLIDHPKLADVAFTQFVIDGGWIGAALGSANEHPAGRRRQADHAAVRRSFCGKSSDRPTAGRKLASSPRAAQNPAATNTSPTAHPRPLRPGVVRLALRLFIC